MAVNSSGLKGLTNQLFSDDSFSGGFPRRLGLGLSSTAQAGDRNSGAAMWHWDTLESCGPDGKEAVQEGAENHSGSGDVIGSCLAGKDHAFLWTSYVGGSGFELPADNTTSDVFSAAV